MDMVKMSSLSTDVTKYPSMPYSPCFKYYSCAYYVNWIPGIFYSYVNYTSMDIFAKLIFFFLFLQPIFRLKLPIIEIRLLYFAKHIFWRCNTIVQYHFLKNYENEIYDQ